MPTLVLHVGFHNYVATDRVIDIVMSDSAPMRRVAQERRKRGRLKLER